MIPMTAALGAGCCGSSPRSGNIACRRASAKLFAETPRRCKTTILYDFRNSARAIVNELSRFTCLW
jgi:hypothetical protein